MFATFWWAEDDEVGQIVVAAGIMVTAGLRWIVRKILWNRTVTGFSRRTPVGLDRTLMDQYRAKAVELRWSSLLALGVSCCAFFWLIAQSRRPLDFVEGITVAIGLASAFGFAALKLLNRRG